MACESRGVGKARPGQQHHTCKRVRSVNAPSCFGRLPVNAFLSRSLCVFDQKRANAQQRESRGVGKERTATSHLQFGEIGQRSKQRREAASERVAAEVPGRKRANAQQRESRGVGKARPGQQHHTCKSVRSVNAPSCVGRLPINALRWRYLCVFGRKRAIAAAA